MVIMIDMHLGEMRRTEHYTVHRSFGCLTFAIADIVDRDVVYQQISGDKGGELISPDTLAFDVIEHNVPHIVQEDFMAVDHSDLLSVGMFSLKFNEHVISDNEKAHAKLNDFIERVVAMLDTEAEIAADMITIMEDC
jgi:hypothetical protein